MKHNIELLDFLSRNPTQFHVVQTMSAVLTKHGFKRIQEIDDWSNLTPGLYFVQRSGAIIAFKMSENIHNGFRIIGSHSDSPALKIKPNALINNNNLLQLGIEVYGGAILSTWFDRDLSIAGKVVYEDISGTIHTTLIDLQEPIAVIPNLAIHLNRNINQGHNINAQTELLPIIAQDLIADFESILQQNIQADIKRILAHDLYLYDTNKASFVGLNKEFIASARLDNQLSCFVSMHALINATHTNNNLMIVVNSHEEVGSVSSSGADGSFLEDVLQRLIVNDNLRIIAKQKSFMVSSDNAHALHPNYKDKHDAYHQVAINHGPVIKYNAQERYATNSESAAYFKKICLDNNIPIQQFAMRSDMACGSTIGPITAAKFGINTVDIGSPTWAMHSIRELAGTHDVNYMLRAFEIFMQD